MTNIFKRSLRSLSHVGLKGSFQSLISIIEDYFFEIRYGLDTIEIVKVEKLDISNEDKKYSRRYQHTRNRHIKNLLRELRLPKDCVFVDFGCGKGRVILWVASNNQFTQVRGIEISNQLCEIARKNLAKYESKLNRSLNVEIIEENVLDYSIRDDDSVFYFFRPFDVLIMAKIIKNIEISFMKKPRKIWIIICESIYDEFFREKSKFQKFMDFSYGGAKFVVYVSN